MSAPRKIWVTHTETEGAIERGVWTDTIRQAPEGTAYHHDDVVRELIAALEECRDELDAYSRQEYPLDHPVHERYRKRDFDANTARIALAKIAQEG